jgi:hypothetical protein
VDLYVIVEYGTPIQIAALDVQESVRKAIETMTGLHVVRVDVHVNGVSFEKEKLEEKAGLENAALMDEKPPALEAEKEIEQEQDKRKPAAEPKKRKAKTSAKTPEDKQTSGQEQDQQQDTEA